MGATPPCCRQGLGCYRAIARLQPSFQYSIIGLVFTHISSDCTSVCAGWGWCWRVWLLVVTELYLLLSGSDTEDGGGSLAPPRPSSPGIMQPHRPGHRTVRTVRSGALHPPPGPCTPHQGPAPLPGPCTPDSQEPDQELQLHCLLPLHNVPYLSVLHTRETQTYQRRMGRKLPYKLQSGRPFTHFYSGLYSCLTTWVIHFP